MAEVMINSLDDILVEGLQYKLPAGASYVDRRESCSFFPLGSNVYSPSQGNKVLRIALNSDGFLDPTTVRFQFTLVNNGTVINYTTGPNSGKQNYSQNRLRPLSGPWCFWRRLRLMCNQTVAEDFTDYNKVHELHEQTQNLNVRNNDDVCGYDFRWDASGGTSNAPNAGSLPGISAGTQRPCSFTPLSGVLSSKNSKYIWLKACPMIFEMEIVSNASDCIAMPGYLGDTTFTGPATINTGTSPPTITAGNTWNDFQIIDCQIKADIIYFHENIANAYAEHLESGKSLPIKYTTYYTMSQSIVGAGNNINVNVARTSTRLKNLFVSFYNNTSPYYWLRTFNSFLHPMRNTTVVDGGALTPAYDPNYELEWQIQIGSRFYPSYPVRSLSEAFYHYLKTLNYPDKYQHSTVIDAYSWRSTKFFIAYDFEKMRDAAFTGINTSSGDLMIIRVRASPIVSASATSSVLTSGVGDNMFVVLVSDNILNISSSGVEVIP